MNAITGDKNAIALSVPGIMRALNNREHDAVHLLYKAYAKPLYKYAFRLTHDQYESKDIVSKTFIRFFEHKGTFDDLNNLRNFLFTTSHNLSLNFLRDKSIRAAIETDVFGPVDGKEGYILNAALHSELTHFLDSLIRQLPEKQRKVIQGLILDGKSVAEIAAELNITPEDARKSKQRGLQFLKRKILYDQFITWLLPLLWTFLSGLRKFL